MGSDRLRDLIDVLVEHADRPGAEVAAAAYLSRFHFDRIVGAALRETPAAFRRRLLLERAAWRLAHGSPVGEVAHGSGYGSPEAFARAFARSFGSAPSRYRGDFRLAAPNGIHFHPPGGLLVPAERSGPMELTDRMIEHDLWLTRQLIDAAAGLDDAALDEPNRIEPVTAAFPDETPSIRAMLDRLVFTKELWTAAIEGRALAASEDRSLAALARRLDDAGGEFRRIVGDIRRRGAWDTAFVDATCDPPESFTFGGVVAHVLTWDAHRRQLLAAVLRARGVEVGGVDPLSWERRTDA